MSINQASIPENYLEIQSNKLLCQPEPQYLFADFFLKAISASLPVPATFGLDGRQVPSTGAAYAASDRDRLQLATELPQNIFALGVDFSKQTGDTVKINRPSYVDSTYTEASRKLVSRQAISTSPITFGSEQTNLQLQRYAGPYDTVNSRVAPIGIEAYDANMGLFSSSSMAGQQLKRDFHKWIDTVQVEMGNVGTALYPDGMAADNDATSTGMYPFTVEMLARAEQTMDEAGLPTFGDGSRLCVLTPLQIKQLKFDPDFLSNSTFHPEFNILYGNYITSVGKFHIFKSVSLQKPTNGSSIAVHRGLVFSPGSFMAGVGRKPEVRTSTDDNYGETVRAIWLADLAWGVADSRMIYQLRSAA